jgi:hypothetical protein
LRKEEIGEDKEREEQKKRGSKVKRGGNIDEERDKRQGDSGRER